MNKSTLSNDFYYALVAFLLQAKQQVIATASEFGLTSVQALTLLTIKQHDQRSMSEFCKLYDCDASNITGIIDGLEQKGLVSRQPQLNDRRVKIIHLEKEGHELQTKLIKRIAESTPDLFNGLSDAEIQQLAKLIQKITVPVN
jgi:DNA-binding MarR family transcriptional regulator